MIVDIFKNDFLAIFTVVLILFTIYLGVVKVFSLSKTNFVYRQISSIYLFLLVLVLVKSFLFDVFIVPSGSMEPTILIGDAVIVNKHTYGLKTALNKDFIIKRSTPKPGDILVFKWPVNDIYMVKRVVGVPGDKIVILHEEDEDGILHENVYRNGELLEQNLVKKTFNSSGMKVKLFEETNGEVTYTTFFSKDNKSRVKTDLTVPKNNYFVLGDNRSNSSDSRYWGFVPSDKLVGKAIKVAFSWDTLKFFFRADRIWKSIN